MTRSSLLTYTHRVGNAENIQSYYEPQILLGYFAHAHAIGTRPLFPPPFVTKYSGECIVKLIRFQSRIRSSSISMIISTGHPIYARVSNLVPAPFLTFSRTRISYQEIACTNLLFVSVSHIEVQTSVRH